jgi:type IV secretion system protein VirB10
VAADHPARWFFGQDRQCASHGHGGLCGLADKVDLHSWQLIKGVVLSSLLGVGTQLSFGNDESDLLRAIRQSTQQSASRAGDQIVRQALNIQPTITVRPGWPLRVVVHKDIVMRPWGREGGNHG